MDERDLELGYLRYVVRFLWPIGTVCAFASCVLCIWEGIVYEALMHGAITGFMAYIWISDKKDW